MSLLNNYLGLILACFGSFISFLLIVSRVKSARFEQESRAQWAAISAGLRDQQQGVQNLNDQVANLSRFQGKSSRLLLSRIERNAQALRSCTDELKQVSALRTGVAEVISETVSEVVSEIKDSVRQTERTINEMLESAEKRLSAEITSMSGVTEHQSEQLSRQLDLLQSISESDVTGLLNQQFEQIQNQISGQSELSRNQGQQLGKIFQAASKLGTRQHQALTLLINNLEALNERQFALLAEDQAAIKYELQQPRPDISDLGISALQSVAEDIINQIESTQSDILSELKSVQFNIEESISSAEDELLSESRSLSGAQYQLSDELEQHTRSATDQHLSAIAEASDDIQNQLADSIQSSLMETVLTLQTAIDRVEADLKSDNRKLAEALIKMQQKSAG